MYKPVICNAAYVHGFETWSLNLREVMCFDILKQFVSELECYYNASQTDLFVLSFFVI